MLSGNMPSSFTTSSYLLTFAQDGFNLEDDFDTTCNWLGSIGELKYLRVGVEKHQSGDPHWHAVVRFGKRVNISTSGFDYRGKHPNVKPVGKRVADWKQCIDYISKDGQWREFGTQRHGTESIWSTVCEASSSDDALAIVRSNQPRDFVLNRRNLDYALEKMFPVRRHETFQPRGAETFRLPDELVRYVSGNLV